MQQTLTSNRIRVSVGNMVFDIPSNKMNELINILSKWQSIQISEANPSPFITYKGQSLVNG